ncbi:50S ribosomal protein L3 [Candidatus Dependentiae bacterium]|nr:50S ribosomal protein L3 [Candidatus Dependentiae bacterium]
MVNGLWGKKIGMTQVFNENRVIPVTAIDINNWYVTQVKTKEKDGYSAVQIGCVKDRYVGQEFSLDWVKKPKQYFSTVREVRSSDDTPVTVTVGQPADFVSMFALGDMVDVWGVTIGRGFAGGMKRHGFSGGKASHGSKLGRAPGSLSFMRSQGRVIKGKRMPGHMGTANKAIKNLQVVKVEPGLVLVKGSIPGKSGSMVFIKKK